MENLPQAIVFGLLIVGLLAGLVVAALMRKVIKIVFPKDNVKDRNIKLAVGIFFLYVFGIIFDSHDFLVFSVDYSSLIAPLLLNAGFILGVIVVWTRLRD